MAEEKGELELPERWQKIRLPLGWNYSGERLCADLGIPERCVKGTTNERAILVYRARGEADVQLDQAKHEAQAPAPRATVSAAVLTRLKAGSASTLELQGALAVALERLGVVAT